MARDAVTRNCDGCEGETPMVIGADVSWKYRADEAGEVTAAVAAAAAAAGDGADMMFRPLCVCAKRMSCGASATDCGEWAAKGDGDARVPIISPLLVTTTPTDQ